VQINLHTFFVLALHRDDWPHLGRRKRREEVNEGDNADGRYAGGRRTEDDIYYYPRNELKHGVFGAYRSGDAFRKSRAFLRFTF
jgi:hypothetical protein